MKTSDIETSKPWHWKPVGRQLRPYVIDPVTVTKYPLAEEPLPPYADADEGRLFLLDPIHPHLLALTPGDPDSFLAFATQFGLRELVEWAIDQDLPALVSIISRYDSGYRHFAPETFAEVWTDRHVVHAVTEEQALLREVFREAQGHEARDATRVVLSHGWGHGAFQIRLGRDEASDALYEEPLHVWSRAWFELFEGVIGDRLPTACAYCGEPFMSQRSNAAYCPGKGCQELAYDARRSKTPERREYQREYKQRQRRKQQSKRPTSDDEKGDNNGIN
jgi:hypothetical protein